MTSYLRISGRVAVIAILALVAAMWFSLSPQAAHADSAIGGAQVLDSNYQPVVGARVSITDGYYTFDFVTDAIGQVRFPDDPGYSHAPNGYTLFVAPGSGSSFPAQYWDGKSSATTEHEVIRYGESNQTVVLAAPIVVPSATPTPTATPVAPAETALSAANHGTLTTASTLTAGSSTTVTVGGATPGDTVNAWFFSTPTSAGAHVVAANGTIAVVVPATLAAGTHRLVITNAAGVVIGWTAVTVAAAPLALASTGANVGGLTGGALALVLLGGALLAVRRIRRPHATR